MGVVAGGGGLPVITHLRAFASRMQAAKRKFQGKKGSGTVPISSCTLLYTCRCADLHMNAKDNVKYERVHILWSTVRMRVTYLIASAPPVRVTARSKLWPNGVASIMI